MNITVAEQCADSAVHAVALTVEQTGMTITVKGGDFTVEREAYSIVDQDFVATADPTDDTLVTGFLAREIATGDPVLIVDEEVLSGNDVPFIFQGSPYKLLHRFYQLKVPAGATDLDSVDATVFNLVPHPPQPGSEEE